MAKIQPFEEHPEAYEDWFVQNRFVYHSELEAFRRHLPKDGLGIEIGLGSGLFAGPLGIRFGVEPSKRMRQLAAKRGINAVEGVAESLPFRNNFFDFALMVTTICFLDDVLQALRESRRIIKMGGKLIIGLVDKDSPVGKMYQKYQRDNVFYRYATFYSTDEVVGLMKDSGFDHFYFTQTVFSMLDEINEPEQVTGGYGKGSFVVISAEKQNLKNKSAEKSA